MSGFTIDIVDDCSTSSDPAAATSSGITTTTDHDHLIISLVTHFAISNGHGVYYPNTTDVPATRAGYFDPATLTLSPMGEQ